MCVCVCVQWRTVGQRIGGGTSGVMSQNIWGAQSLRGSVDRAGGGGSFFIFRLENVQSGAYLSEIST